MLSVIGKVIVIVLGVRTPRIGMRIAHYPRVELLAKRHRLSISKQI
jgi:hypothetical protein